MDDLAIESEDRQIERLGMYWCVCVQMIGGMDGRMDVCIAGYIDGYIYACTDQWRDHTDGESGIDGLTDGCHDNHNPIINSLGLQDPHFSL